MKRIEDVKAVLDRLGGSAKKRRKRLKGLLRKVKRAVKRIREA